MYSCETCSRFLFLYDSFYLIYSCTVHVYALNGHLVLVTIYMYFEVSLCVFFSLIFHYICVLMSLMNVINIIDEYSSGLFWRICLSPNMAINLLTWESYLIFSGFQIRNVLSVCIFVNITLHDLER